MGQFSVSITITGLSTRNYDQSCPTYMKPDTYVDT